MQSLVSLVLGFLFLSLYLPNFPPKMAFKYSYFFLFLLKVYHFQNPLLDEQSEQNVLKPIHLKRCFVISKSHVLRARCAPDAVIMAVTEDIGSAIQMGKDKATAQMNHA